MELEDLDRRLLHLEDWAWGAAKDNGVTAKIQRMDSDIRRLQCTMWAASGAVILFNSLLLPVLLALAIRWIG